MLRPVYRQNPYRSVAILGAFSFALGALVLTTGCTDTGGSGAQFLANLVNARYQQRETGEKIALKQQQQVANLLMAVFGTPDNPDDPFNNILQVLDMRSISINET